jgi:hypothetical protein
MKARQAKVFDSIYFTKFLYLSDKTIDKINSTQKLDLSFHGNSTKRFWENQRCSRGSVLLHRFFKTVPFCV